MEKLCVRGETTFRQAFTLQRAAPKWVEARVVLNESVLYVHHAYLDNFVRLCRDSMLFQIKVLIDLCCIDYPFREQRFSLVYMLCSVHEEYCSEATLGRTVSLGTSAKASHVNPLCYAMLCYAMLCYAIAIMMSKPTCILGENQYYDLYFFAWVFTISVITWGLESLPFCSMLCLEQ